MKVSDIVRRILEGGENPKAIFQRASQQPLWRIVHDVNPENSLDFDTMYDKDADWEDDLHHKREYFRILEPDKYGTLLGFIKRWTWVPDAGEASQFRSKQEAAYAFGRLSAHGLDGEYHSLEQVPPEDRRDDLLVLPQRVDQIDVEKEAERQRENPFMVRQARNAEDNKKKIRQLKKSGQWHKEL